MLLRFIDKLFIKQELHGSYTFLYTREGKCMLEEEQHSQLATLATQTPNYNIA